MGGSRNIVGRRGAALTAAALLAALATVGSALPFATATAGHSTGTPRPGLAAAPSHHQASRAGHGLAAEPPWTMVDGDGRAAPGDCDSSRPASRSIGRAVSVAGAGGRIAVCPGVYREHLHLDASTPGLRIYAQDSFKAAIAPPAGQGGPAIDIEGATDIRIRGLRVHPVGTVGHPSIGPLVLLGLPACTPEPVAIRIRDSSRVEVRGIRINTDPACGYRVGVSVERSDVALPFDRISDFLSRGVMAGPGSSVAIEWSEMRFIHVGRAQAMIGDTFPPDPTGIELDHVRTGSVVHTGVFSVIPHGGREQPELWAGVWVHDASGPVLIEHSGTKRTIQAGFLVTGSPKVRITESHARFSERDGFFLDDLSGARIRGGTAGLDGRGIYLGPGTSGVVVSDVLVNRSRVLDCYDASAGDGTAGTANRWIDNRGRRSDPVGLCQPPS